MKPLAISVRQAAEATSLSTTRIRQAIYTGELRVKATAVARDGRATGRRLILVSDLEAWLDSLPDA